MKPFSPYKQLHKEQRQAQIDQKRLDDFAWKAATSVSKYSVTQLRAAALLADHQGQVGFVARAAAAELKRRGL